MGLGYSKRKGWQNYGDEDINSCREKRGKTQGEWRWISEFQVFISKLLAPDTEETIRGQRSCCNQPTQVIQDVIHWDTHRKIHSIKMRCALSTTATFVGKTSVTFIELWRKMSSVQYQLSDPKAGLSAKILNKSNVSRCTYYWLEPEVAASFKDYMPVQAVYSMTAGICHVRKMWQVKLCPLKYLNTLEELNLENVNVVKSARVIYSLLLGAYWTRFINIQVDTVISLTYFHYEPIPI